MNTFQLWHGLIPTMPKRRVTKKSLERLLKDPNLSDLFKTTLAKSLEKDPFEACLDAELLYNALKAREQTITEDILDP
ncbi:MAG: hypothetical protein JNL74_13925 [Fibrobacteres bacterium]|nr:hypothetical protein [Fibrobacterota bacterium]